jgi:hypothetical protein
VSEAVDDAKPDADHERVVVDGDRRLPEALGQLRAREEPDVRVAPVVEPLESLALVDCEKGVAEAYYAQREALGFPLLPKTAAAAE